MLRPGFRNLSCKSSEWRPLYGNLTMSQGSREVTAVAKATKKSSAKKASSRAAAKKKATRTKTVKKKAPARKAPKKKVPKKTAKKKTPPSKKAVVKKSRKKTAKKKIAKKKVTSRKTPAKRKHATKKAAKKKQVAKKAGKKKQVAKKAGKKKQVAKNKTSIARVEKAPAKKKRSPRAGRNTAVAKVAAAKPASAITRVIRTRTFDLEKVKISKVYKPSPKDKYMGPKHMLYFRNKLQHWREELIIESQETLEHLKSEIRDVGDEAERASRESDNILELRTRDRYRKLLKKIDEAMKRIEDGSYGYCEETGEEIGIDRLQARPIATLTVDAQERRELFRRQFRDDR